MTKEEEITKLLEKLRTLDNEQVMYIVGATNAFYMTQQQIKDRKKNNVNNFIS
ncbi:hypothetical protein [Lysinibacillus fusiformis]|uniref:hypothetical protein n=1 Tax=Lysinibacillus fusiformis TaxID=28031 RepID=UPI003AAD98E8